MEGRPSGEAPGGVVESVHPDETPCGKAYFAPVEERGNRKAVGVPLVLFAFRAGVDPGKRNSDRLSGQRKMFSRATFVARPARTDDRGRRVLISELAQSHPPTISRAVRRLATGAFERVCFEPEGASEDQSHHPGKGSRKTGAP